MSIVLLNQTPTQTQLAGSLIERYQSLVLAQKPVAYWPMNEASGTSVLDLSGHGNTGTIQGGVTLGQPGPIGGDPADTAMGFNGSSGYITVSSSSDLSPEVGPSGAITLLAWMNMATTPSGGNGGFLVGKGQLPGAPPYSPWEYGLLFGADNQVNFIIWSSVGSNYFVLSAPTTLGTVHCVGATFSAARGIASLYIDGVLVASTTSFDGSNAPSVTSAPVLIGAGDANYLEGSIAQVAIFPTALDAATIQQLYLAGKTAITGWDPAGNLYTGDVVEGSYTTTVLADEPVAYWPLAVAVNGVTPDLSGNHHVGTLSDSGITSNVNGPLNRMGDAATSFLGTDGYINVPTLVPNGASLSIACWVRLRSLQGCLVAMGSSPSLGAEAQTAVYCGSGGWIGGNTNYSLPGGLDVFTPTLDTWYHVVFVYEANVGSGLYVDGQGSLSNGTLGNPEDDLYVTIGAGNMNGWYNNTGWYLDGDLANVAIYDYALTAAQVLAHYQASQGTFQRDMMSTRKVYVPSLVEAGSYTNTVLSLDPAAYWPLAVAVNGVTPDLSGNRNTAVVESGVSLNINGPFHQMGDVAMGFDGGSSSYIPGSLKAPSTSNGITVCAWYRPQGSGVIVWGGNSSVSGPFNAYSPIIWVNGTNLCLALSFSGTPNFILSDIVVLDGWAFAAITVDESNTATAFVDGVSQGTTTQSVPPWSVLSNVAFGVGYTASWAQGNGGEYYFVGDIAHVAIFPYALSPAQVALLYNAGQGQFLDSTIPA